MKSSARRRAPAAHRERPALSREAVLEAGLRIARREDLDHMTIRKLADELGVTPMAARPSRSLSVSAWTVSGKSIGSAASRSKGT